MVAGTKMAEDPSGPRLTAELMRISRSIGELTSSQKLTEQKVNEVHKAIFIGNGNPGILQWLLKHDSQLSKLLGQSTEQKKQTLKTISFSGAGTAALLLALKLVYFLLTKHWPTVP